jgi:hypothetical protein
VSGSSRAASGLRSLGIPHPGKAARTQMIAVAIAYFLCFVIEALIKRFIYLILDEFVLVGNRTEQVIKARNDLASVVDVAPVRPPSACNQFSYL